MKMPGPGCSILIEGFDPSSRPRGRNTSREASEVAGAIYSAEEPLGLASPEGLISSFFLLLTLSMAVLRWTETVPINRPRALNIRKRSRAADMPIMAKTPCSMLLKRITHSPIQNIMRSYTTISICLNTMSVARSYSGRNLPESDQCTERGDQVTNSVYNNGSERRVRDIKEDRR